MNLANLLNLTRPLTVFDCEATGSDPLLDRIIQMSVTKHYPTVNGDPKDPIAWKSYVNPGTPIPSESTDVHHITDAMVASAPTFAQVAPKLAPKMVDTDFLGHNVSFDLKLFRAECKRVGVVWDWEVNGSLIVDSLRIRQITRPNTLSAIYLELFGRELDAHDAAIDVGATEEIFVELLRLYPTVPRTVVELNTFCFPLRPGYLDVGGKLVWRNGEACIGFGKKHKGTPLKELVRKDPGYLQWMLSNDFPADVKQVVDLALRGTFPVKPAAVVVVVEPDPEQVEETEPEP